MELQQVIENKFSELKGDLEKRTKSIEQLEKSYEELKGKIDAATIIENKGIAEYAQEMQKQLNGIEAQLKERDTRKHESFGEQLHRQLSSEEYKSATKNRKAFDIQLKASTISTTNSFTQTNSPIVPFLRQPGIDKDPRREFPLTANVSTLVAPVSDTVDAIYRSGETTGTAMKAEGAAYGQSDISWTSEKWTIEKITDYIVVTEEKLEDADFMAGEINDVLMYNIANKLEVELHDGTGSSNRLKGLIGSSIAKTFSSSVKTVGDANEFDVLKAAMLQVRLGNTSNTKAKGFNATAILVNPVDYFNMLMLKNDDRAGLKSTGVVIDDMGMMRVLGVPVMMDDYITSGTYLVGDLTKAKLYMRKNTTIRVWDQNSTDPIYGLVTVTAVARGALVVQAPSAYAFVTGTFVAGIAAISA